MFRNHAATCTEWYLNMNRIVLQCSRIILHLRKGPGHPKSRVLSQPLFLEQPCMLHYSAQCTLGHVWIQILFFLFCQFVHKCKIPDGLLMSFAPGTLFTQFNYKLWVNTVKLEDTLKFKILSSCNSHVFRAKGGTDTITKLCPFYLTNLALDIILRYSKV